MRKNLMLVVLACLFAACAANQAVTQPEPQPVPQPMPQPEPQPPAWPPADMVLQFKLPVGWQGMKPSPEAPGNTVAIIVNELQKGFVIVNVAPAALQPPEGAITELAVQVSASGGLDVQMTIGADAAVVTWSFMMRGQMMRGKGMARLLKPETATTLLVYGMWPPESDAFCAADIEKIFIGIDAVLPGDQVKQIK